MLEAEEGLLALVHMVVEEMAVAVTVVFIQQVRQQQVLQTQVEVEVVIGFQVLQELAALVLSSSHLLVQQHLLLDRLQ